MHVRDYNAQYFHESKASFSVQMMGSLQVHKPMAVVRQLHSLMKTWYLSAPPFPSEPFIFSEGLGTV
jgi:hypothetical protein